MKRFFPHFIIAAILLFSVNLFAQLKKEAPKHPKERKRISSLKQKNDGNNFDELLNQKERHSLKKVAESSTPPDSVIANLANGKVEKYYYKYNEKGLLVEEKVDFWEDETIDISYRTTYEYDNNRNETLYLEQTWDGTQWISSLKLESGYDENGNIVSRFWQNWNEEGWGNLSRWSFEYDSEGNNTVTFNEIWQDNMWLPFTRKTDEFDNDGNLISSTIEAENGGVLENFRKNVLTYDANGNRLTLSDFLWFVSEWFELSKNVYEYDSENRVTSNTHFSFTGGDSLEAQSLITYSYFPEELKEVTVDYNYIEGELVPFTRVTTEFNQNEDNTYILRELYNTNISEWEEHTQINYTYNNEGKSTGFLSEEWRKAIWKNSRKHDVQYDLEGNNTYQAFHEWEQGQWVLDSLASITLTISEEIEFLFFAAEIFAYYGDDVTAINEAEFLPVAFSLEQNYPNPFNPATKIKYYVASNENITIKVFDAIGREMAVLVNEQKQPGVYEADFNADGLSSGIYFYSIKAGNFVSTKKMMLLK